MTVIFPDSGRSWDGTGAISDASKDLVGKWNMLGAALDANLGCSVLNLGRH
jgi:hypothetical protein